MIMMILITMNLLTKVLNIKKEEERALSDVISMHIPGGTLIILGH